MKTLFKSINVVIALILLVCALGVALLAFPIFGNQALIVRSGSMQPTIDIGSVLVARPESAYKPGDVIAFRSENNSKTIITHRVKEVNKDARGIYYSTQGDANKTVDGWTIRPDQVIGKTFLVVPYAGRVLMFARSDMGIPLLIIIPAIIVILFEGFSIFREIRKHRNPVDELDMTRASTRKHGFAIKLILVSGIVLIIGGVVGSTFAFQSDVETSQQNVFQAAASFGSPTPSVSPTVTPTPTPQIAQTLVMNEILPLSTEDQGNDNCQFLELWNGSGVTVNLQQFKLTDGVVATPIAVVNSSTLLPSGQFAVLVKSNGIIQQCDALESMPDGIVTANLGGQIDLNTGTLQLLDAGNVVIDTIIWGNNPNPEPAIDQSIERDPTGLDSALGMNFEPSDFVVRTIPRPGE